MDEPILIWDNYLETATLDPSSEASGFAVENILDRREFTGWQGEGMGDITLAIDLGADPPPVRAFAGAGHDLGTQDATITLEYSDDNITYTEAASAAPETNAAFALILDDEETRRYWLVTIAGHDAPPTICVMFLSDILELPEVPEGMMDPHKTRDEYEENIGGEGHLLGIVRKYSMRTFSLSFQYLSRSWMRDTFRPFWKANGRRPLFLLWAPATYPGDCYFGRLTGEGYSAPFEEQWQSLDLQFEGLEDV